MQQTLFYIPAEIYGVPVFGLGLLFAIWLIVSAAIVAALVRRQGFNEDTRSYLPVMLLLGVVIAFVLPLLCEARGLPIRGYGMMILLAVLSSIGLANWRAQRCGVNPEVIVTLAFWLVLPGILGARAVYVSEYWFTEYWPAYQQGGLGALLFQVCNVANGGLVVYGAFIGGALGLILFCRKNPVPLLATMDLVAPSVLLGAAIGRIGCLLNGCCYGGECDLPWKVTFPWNSPVHIHQFDTGAANPLGITFKQGKNGLPLIGPVTPNSPAAQEGLKPGLEVLEINGMSVATVEEARWAMLQIDKLNFAIERDDGSRFPWRVDDPPRSVLDGTEGKSAEDSSAVVTIPIYGFTVSGRAGDRPTIVSVVSQTPEAAAGLRVGQHVVALSGLPVATMSALDALLQRHRKMAWLHSRLAGGRPPIEIDVPRPLPRSLAVHPTQVYSMIDGFLLCFLLLAYDNFRRRDGELAALTMTVYPVARFLTEAIRTDEPPIWGTGLHISQNISVVLFLIAMVLWAYVLRQPPGTAFTRRATA
jgi:phosphatidylglycerol:prolipoprotein diacylglycerol transferase